MRRLTKLHLSIFVNPKQPRTDYPHLKLAATAMRHLVPCVLHLCKEHNSGSDRDEHRLMCMEAVAACYKVIEDGDIHLNARESTLLLHATERSLMHYGWLASDAITRGDLLWRVAWKFHMQWHMAYEGRWLNPRVTWNYSAEAFVGKMCKLAHACTFNTKKKKVAAKVIEKYHMLLQMIFCEKF